MTLVAVMTQQARSAYLAAFLRDRAADGAVVIVSDEVALEPLELPDGTVVREVKPPAYILPSGRLLTARVRERLVAKARAGSSLGLRVERLVRRFMWRIRYFDRVAIIVRQRKRQTLNLEEGWETLGGELESIHAESSITEIACFDIYDLPVLLEFADRYHVPVVVR